MHNIGIFFKTVEKIGHKVDADTVHISTKKVQAMVQSPLPNNIQVFCYTSILLVLKSHELLY